MDAGALAPTPATLRFVDKTQGFNAEVCIWEIMARETCGYSAVSRTTCRRRDQRWSLMSVRNGTPLVVMMNYSQAAGTLQLRSPRP